MHHNIYNNKKISPIGLGTWALGGISYGPIREKIAKNILCKSFELGINFFDTANLYSNVENLIGSVFKNKDKIVIATKCGLKPHTGWEMPEDFSINNIKKSTFQSLKRLRTDFIDILLLHSPSKKTILSFKFEKIINLLNNFRNKGLIGNFGVSVRDPLDSFYLIKNFKEIKILEVNFNLLDQRAKEIQLFEIAKNNKVNLIIRTPLAFGFLSSEKKKKLFSKTDHRKRWSNEQIDKWNFGRKLFLLEKPKNITMSQFAINFCKSFDGVTSVIPGATTVDQVIENYKTTKIKFFTKKFKEKLYNIYKSENWIVEKKKLIKEK